VYSCISRPKGVYYYKPRTKGLYFYKPRTKGEYYYKHRTKGVYSYTPKVFKAAPYIILAKTKYCLSILTGFK